MNNYFVYIWENFSSGEYYVGVHKGKEDDGYICSGILAKRKIRKTKSEWNRTILSKNLDKNQAFLLERVLVVTQEKDPLSLNLRQGGYGGYISNSFYESIKGDNNPMKDPKIVAKAVKAYSKERRIAAAKIRTPERIRSAKENMKRLMENGKHFKAIGKENPASVSYIFIDSLGNETHYETRKDLKKNQKISCGGICYALDNNNGEFKKGRLKGCKIIKTGKE